MRQILTHLSRLHFTTVILVCVFAVANPLPAQQLPKLEFRKWSGDINVPDPVAVAVDDQGQVFVTQTRRRKVQDLDIREHRSWVPTDVGLRSIDEKRDFYHEVMKIGGNQELQKTFVGDVNKDGEYDWRDLTVVSEVIYRLVDEDEDGTADEITVFANDFKTEVTGIAAGVMAHGKDVYATVAPDLWKLSDENSDGVSDTKDSIAHGFGLHVAYGGHDMHGLTMGPDGKVYWSIGDKGINVKTKDGQQFAYPNQGGVMRCNPDGTDFEVFAHGLRNVQELAFDQYGNLFGVDNDADQTNERERFVYIVNQMDAGWRCNYQYRGSAYNPWTAEHLWELPGENHPAYIIPPISHYVDGPAGFKFNPGTALAEAYTDYFFLTSAPNGYQYAFQVEESGDSFKMINDHQIGSGLAIVGLAFGPDGALYGADWDGGYPLDEKGSVVRIDVKDSQSEIRTEVQRLLRNGFNIHKTGELVGLLGHADMRVRMGAQFELVVRKDAYSLAAKSQDTGASTVSRLHGVWGLGQLGRSGDTFARDTLGLLLADKDVHVRRQAVKTYGELLAADGFPLIKLLTDDDIHVRTLAALALARHPTKTAAPSLLEQADALQENQYYLRHAIVTALSACGTDYVLAAEEKHESESRRLCCALALRRKASRAIATFLDDDSTMVANAVARGIHDDDSIPGVLPKLASRLLKRQDASEAFFQRALNANFRIGDAASANRVIQFAENQDFPVARRVTALDALSDWLSPPELDRVDGRNRKESHKERDLDRKRVQSAVTELANSSNVDIKQHAIATARSLRLRIPLDSLQAVVVNHASEDSVRAEAFRSLSEQMVLLAQESASSGGELLQLEAVELLCKISPESATNLIADLIASEDTPLRVKQASVQQLGKLGSSSANRQLEALAESIVSGGQESEYALDVYEALFSSGGELGNIHGPQAEALREFAKSKVGDAAFARFAFSRDGGDPELGRSIFRSHVGAQCSRCHKIGRSGSEVGPELTEIAAKRDPDYLLRSVIRPSADIDQKYRTEMFLLSSGDVLKGVLISEGEKVIVIADEKGEKVEIPTEDLEERIVQKTSLMPQLETVLSPREIRDLVAYLRTLR